MTIAEPTPRELGIEVNDVDLAGIHFMCHDRQGNNCHVLLTANQARRIAEDLIEAADDLDALFED